METYALKVDDASAVASPPRAHKQVSVPGVAEWSALVSAEVCIWLGPSHRQAKHNEKTLELMGPLTHCQDMQEM